MSVLKDFIAAIQHAVDRFQDQQDGEQESLLPQERGVIDTIVIELLRVDDPLVLRQWISRQIDPLPTYYFEFFRHNVSLHTHIHRVLNESRFSAEQLQDTFFTELRAARRKTGWSYTAQGALTEEKKTAHTQTEQTKTTQTQTAQTAELPSVQTQLITLQKTVADLQSGQTAQQKKQQHLTTQLTKMVHKNKALQAQLKQYQGSEVEQLLKKVTVLEQNVATQQRALKKLSRRNSALEVASGKKDVRIGELETQNVTLAAECERLTQAVSRIKKHRHSTRTGEASAPSRSTPSRQKTPSARPPSAGLFSS